MYMRRDKEKDKKEQYHRSKVHARWETAADAELDEKYPLLGIGRPVGTDKHRDKSGERPEHINTSHLIYR